MAEPGWKLAALILISNMKWTYLSLHGNSTRVSPEKPWNWITRNSPDRQSGVAWELMIWWAPGSSRVPKLCVCRTLLRASPLLRCSVSLGPEWWPSGLPCSLGPAADPPRSHPGPHLAPASQRAWRVGNTCSSVAHAASRLQKGCQASCMCLYFHLSPCSGALPPT